MQASRNRWMAIFAALLCAAALGIPVSSAHAAGTGHLKAFASDAELMRYLDRLSARRQHPPFGDMMALEAAPPPAPPPPPPAAGALSTVTVTAAKAESDNITNTQEAGVDEGDIVKKHGDLLVILRRGRLFTVSLANNGMKPVDSINAYPPQVDARDDWYDEMLIDDDRIIVIGYSYGRGGTEINRFHLGADGRLAFEDAYQLRSNDYYSSRNYASRLIGHTLIFYSPLNLGWWGRKPVDLLPAVRRWTGDANGAFTRIVSARHIYIPPVLLNSDAQIDTLHTVTTCDVTAKVMPCQATSVFGPDGRTFYVAQDAVYVWATPWWYGGDKPRAGLPPSFLYRLPLDGSEPTAAGVRGAPTDQFSFREDGPVLNVLVRAEAAGDAMWAAEASRSDGAIALLRLPLGSFGDASREIPMWRYRALPAPIKDEGFFQNRFVGGYVLYGSGNGWIDAASGKSMLVAAPLDGGAPTELPLAHSVDRIEIMGRDAVAIGSDGAALDFTAVELSRGEPRLGDRYALQSAVQGETRSHGFFFKPDADSRDDTDGVLGLPIARPGREAYRQLFDNSAGMIFLRHRHRAFAPLGELDAASEGIVNDDCVASCVDWYGNARPIFAGTRTFALLGYELVEGAVRDGAMRETGRISFAPVKAAEARKPS